jgi:hypothetical protein
LALFPHCNFPHPSTIRFVRFTIDTRQPTDTRVETPDKLMDVDSELPMPDTRFLGLHTRYTLMGVSEVPNRANISEFLKSARSKMTNSEYRSAIASRQMAWAYPSPSCERGQNTGSTMALILPAHQAVYLHSLESSRARDYNIPRCYKGTAPAHVYKDALVPSVNASVPLTPAHYSSISVSFPFLEK